METNLSSLDCFGDNVSRNFVTQEYWSNNVPFRVSSRFTAAVMVLYMLVGIPGNTVIILTILQKKLFKETTHMLLLALAVSDLLFCVLIMPLNAIAGFSGGYIFGSSDYIRCQVCQTGLIFVLLTVVAVNIFGLISVDRFIFIKFPLQYKKWITVPRVLVAIIGVWTFSTIQAILPIFKFGETEYTQAFAVCIISLIRSKGNLYYGVLLVLLALPSVACTVVANIWIACIVRKQIRKVYMTKRGFGNREEQKEYDQGLRKRIRKKRNQKQLTLMRAFGAILISNMVVWTPCVILIVVTLANGELIPISYYVFVYITFTSHTVIHPLIEGCLIPELKATFKKIFRPLACCKKLSKTKRITKSDSSELKDVKSSDSSGQDVRTMKCCDICSFALLSTEETEVE